MISSTSSSTDIASISSGVFSEVLSNSLSLNPPLILGSAGS